MKRFLLFSVIPTLALSFPYYPDSSITYPTYCQLNEKDFKTIKYDNVAICNRNVSTGTKSKIYEAYNIPSNERNEYTIDHLIPLSMGGSNNITNLWPQHKSISTSDIEGETYNRLEGGNITHDEAINIILTKKLP